MRIITGAAALAAALHFHPGPGAAQDVTLSSVDGRLTVSGDLVAYDGEYLRLETEFGQLTLDARGLTCEGPGCPLLSSGVIEARIEGAAVIADTLLPPVLDAFAATQGLTLERRPEGDAVLYDLSDPGAGGPVMRLRVRASSGDAGLMALVTGEADLALSLMPMAGEDLWLHVLALDAFVPAVSALAPAGRIDMAGMLAMLDGAPAAWPGRDADAGPVQLHMPHPALGEQHALIARLVTLGVVEMATPAALHPTTRAQAAAIARDPRAFGILLRSQIGDQPLRSLALSESCGLQLRADPFSLKAGDYPLVQPLYAIQMRTRLPLRLRQLLDFFGEPAAAAAIRAAGFVETGPDSVPAVDLGERLIGSLLDPASQSDPAFAAELRRLAALMQQTRRLSVAIRFEPGTAEPDATSRVLIRQLGRAIESGGFDGQEIVLVGFTDTIGNPDANRRLSRQRAEAVRRDLIEAAPLRDPGSVALRADGYGPLLPVACNDSEWGRALNRRVEVWLAPAPD